MSVKILPARPDVSIFSFKRIKSSTKTEKKEIYTRKESKDL